MGTSPDDFGAPFAIGRVLIPNRVVLAPMAGLTNSAYRRHLKAHGAGLVTTEMVSAHGLIHGNKRTDDYLGFAPEERPIAVQLFGDTPEAMARAARLVLEGRSGRAGDLSAVPDMLDINMGCPVRKVVRTGAGSALLADPERAIAMAEAVVKVASEHGVPVTIKLRSGLQEGERAAVDLAPRLEEVGVAALGVHPRATSQHYRGNADHTITGYIEKPTNDYTVSMGIYVFEPRILEYIPVNQRLDFPDLVLKLIAAGERVVAYPFDGYWMDLGHPDDYQKANEDFNVMKHQFLPED